MLLNVHVSITRNPLATVAALAAAALAVPAQAQYAPYGATYNPPATTQAPPVYSQTPAYGAVPPYGQNQQASQQAPQYGQIQQPAQQTLQYGQTQQTQPSPSYGQVPVYSPSAAYAQSPASAQPTASPAANPTAPQYGGAGVYQGYSPATGYVSPYSAPRVAMAYQQPAASGEHLPLTAPAETVSPGVPQYNGGYVPPPQATPDSYSLPSSGYAPTPGYPSPGLAGGAAPYGGCNTSPYGACDPCGPATAVCAPQRCGGYWFGGVYGLFMDRDDANKYSLAYVTDPSMPTTYPTTPANVVMNTRSVDNGFQPGVEFRLGRAFGGGADPCGGCCGPTWGLEAAYWILFDEDDYAEYVNPTGTSRTYTMMPMYGLQYDHGAGYLPVNQYWDHGMPSDPANPVRVTRIRQSSSFEAQNLEINLLRLGVCGGGGCGSSFSACGGLDACAGGCNDGCCAPKCSRYSCTAVCGFRWMQFDEDFMFGVDYTNPAWPTPSGYLNYWSNVENNLIGAQIGCNGMYRIGCKWGLHLNTLVGVYGNDIDVRQYFVSPTGDVRYIGTGENFDVTASKTDVAMLGELRVGASYQYSCRCRLYGGWRAIGVTGIALATDQTPNAFLSSAQMANYVNSNGSMILHGLQAGVEWNY